MLRLTLKPGYKGLKKHALKARIFRRSPIAIDSGICTYACILMYIHSQLNRIYRFICEYWGTCRIHRAFFTLDIAGNAGEISCRELLTSEEPLEFR